MEELYLDDADFEVYKEQIDKINSAIEERLNKIIEQLNIACNGIGSGCLHDNLITYVDKLSLFTNQLAYVTNLMKENATFFCREIENIDTI